MRMLLLEPITRMFAVLGPALDVKCFAVEAIRLLTLHANMHISHFCHGAAGRVDWSASASYNYFKRSDGAQRGRAVPASQPDHLRSTSPPSACSLPRAAAASRTARAWSVVATVRAKLLVSGGRWGAARPPPPSWPAHLDKRK